MFYSWRDVEKEHVIYVLEKVKKLFSDQSNWIDWPVAINAAETNIDPCSPDAKKWNLMGALVKFGVEKYSQPLADYIDCATREFLNDLSDESLIKGNLNYEDEYALICLGLEYISKED